MNEEIMVSICCLVYNHEKYLRQCLDGFMMQKTNFKFEVLIHDDASTDHSADIIREYEEKYPDIIKPIYQTENQYSKGVKISWTYQFSRAKGKYIALCEGDDYWTDPLKLQKQFDALEKNTDCVFCTHIVSYVKENGDKSNITKPSDTKLKNCISSEDWIKMMLSSYPFHTSSYFFRTEALKNELNCRKIPSFIENASVGDIPLMLFLALKGNCYYISEFMSSRRMMAIGSWSQRKKDLQFRLNQIQTAINMLNEYDAYSGYKYTDLISNAVLINEMIKCAEKNDFKTCLTPKYRSAFNTFSLKTRISYRFFAMFPKLRPLYLKLRGEA